MADLPLDSKKSKLPLIAQTKEQQIKVTPENAAMLQVHFLSQIYGRLGYIVKLLEGKK